MAEVAHGRVEVRCWKWRLQRNRKEAFQNGKIQGFTLIELLVVIAIIAILAAMLLPVLSRAKEINGMDSAPLYSGVALVYLGPLNDINLKAMAIRHRGRWNMVFCDGHVERGRPRTFFDFNNDEVLKRWSRDNKAHRERP